MTYAELRSALDANEHEHAVQAVSRIRFGMLEARLEHEMRRREAAERDLHEYRLSENDEVNSLRMKIRHLEAENMALRKAVMMAGGPTVQADSRIDKEKEFPRPKGPSSEIYGMRLSPAARALLAREPVDPAAFDRTIDQDEE